MQMCLYQGEPIYSFDILGKNNTLKLDIEKTFRSASKQGLLKCSDCGNSVIFKFNDIEKRIPHFAHLNSGNAENCSYGKESEEHIEGKKIVLNRMRELYPNIYHRMRYRVKSINRFSDLYFQLNEQELIVEFQRTALDFNLFEEKSQNYDSIYINNIWLLSGNKEDLKDITREYGLTFFQRINLNKTNKPVLFLDVENRTITMMAKIVFEDKEINEVTMDKIFHKTYPVDDLIINIDGTIESDFEFSYEAVKLNFIEEYQEKLDIEKKLQVDKKMDSTINLEKYKKKHKREIRPDLRSISYKIYKGHINTLINNYNNDLFETILLACNNNITVYQIVRELLEEIINTGNNDARTLLNRINDFIK